MKHHKLIAILTLCMLITALPAQAGIKSGSFINPITDVAWNEIFPIKIAGIKLFGGGNYDTPDPANFPICICPAPPPLFFRVGISMSFWEPARMIETVNTPFYFPFLGMEVGGSIASKGFLSGKNAEMDNASQEMSSFGQAHYWIFPIWTVMELLTDFICLERTGLDVAYITEVDPLWNDSQLSFIIQPEALLFANPFAQMACAADSVAVNVWAPLDPLFWCIGSSGSSYPMTGHVGNENLVQAHATMAARMIYKLSRQLLICDPGITLCQCLPTPIWKKSNYKMHAMRPAVRKKAWPLGKSTFFYGSALNPPYRGSKGPGDEFLWMLFRKRACCAF